MPVPRGPIRGDFIGEPPPSQFLAPARWGPEREAVYARILDGLDASGVPYLLAGAVSVNAHSGVWRHTKDLDVFMEERHVDAALDALASRGFGVETVYPEWLSRAYEGDVFVDVIHHNANGLVPVTEEWFPRAVPFDVLGRRSLVVGIEDLVWSKMYVFSRNRCDVADIGHVLYAAGARLDWDVLVGNVGEQGAELLLAHLHLFRWTYPEAAWVVPDEVMARLERAARRAGGRFRGTLLDAVSFRVDVDSWGLPDGLPAGVTTGSDKAT